MTQPWVPVPPGIGGGGGGGGGAVSSVFGRAGAVVAAAGDYTGNQVASNPAVTGLASTLVDNALHELLTDLSTQIVAAIAQANQEVPERLVRRTGSIAETFSRSGANAVQQGAAIASGQLGLYRIGLLKGQTISNAVFLSGGTAAGTPLNQWAALFDPNLNLLATSADLLTAAWASNSEQTFSFTAGSGAVVLPADGAYVLGVMVNATTVPSLVCSQSNTATYGLPPASAGRDTTHTGLTTPATCPNPASMAANANQAYAWVS